MSQEVNFKTPSADIFVRQISAGTFNIPMIFLHDSLGCVELWRDFPTKICTQLSCKAIVYDRQGYGKSSPFSEKRKRLYHFEEAETLIALMNFLQLPKVSLFGHSDGGTIALIAAALYPDRVNLVITEGAHVFVDEVTLAGIREAKRISQTTAIKEKLAKYHGNKVDAIYEAWTETWLDPEFYDWNIENLLPKICCPVLAIQGAGDEYGTQDQVESIAKNVRGKSELYLVPEASHSPHKEQSDAIIAKVKSFI